MMAVDWIKRNRGTHGGGFDLKSKHILGVSGTRLNSWLWIPYQETEFSCRCVIVDIQEPIRFGAKSTLIGRYRF